MGHQNLNLPMPSSSPYCKESLSLSLSLSLYLLNWRTRTAFASHLCVMFVRHGLLVCFLFFPVFFQLLFESSDIRLSLEELIISAELVVLKKLESVDDLH